MPLRHFDKPLGCLVSPALDELATQIFSIAGLSAREREVIAEVTRESLLTVLHSKLSRLLVLELHAARETGRLSGETPEQRWQQFIELSSQQPFWDDLAVHYPSLWRVGANRAMELIARTVLSIGLLPGRAVSLGLLADRGGAGKARREWQHHESGQPIEISGFGAKYRNFNRPPSLAHAHHRVRTMR